MELKGGLGLFQPQSDAKPWTLGGDYLWDLDRACIYVSVCINAPGRGQFIVLYICLSCLE